MDGLDATQQGAGGPEDALDALTDLIPDEVTGEELETNAGQQGGQQAQPEQPQADDPNDPLITLKVDGEDRVLKLSDLKTGAQKYLAGDKRLEEAANMRKQIEPEKEAVLQERQQLKQALDLYVPHLTQLLQIGQPDPALINTDPQEYMRQTHAHQMRVAELTQAQAAQAELTRRDQVEQAQQTQARSAEEQTKLLDVLPEWKDPAKAKEEAGAIDGYLQKAGFNDPERNGITDHRIIVVARKAMLYDQLMAQQAQATQRVAKVPPRTERPGASTQGQQGEQNRRAALDRFQKAPSVDTLADLL